MRVAFYTLGCKVNQYETDLMKNMFIKSGHEVKDFSKNSKISDVYVINSCSVTNLSTRKTRDYLNRARRQNKEAVIVLAGCYAQELKNELELEKMNLNVDLIIGNEEKNNIVKYVDEYIELRKNEKQNTVQNKVSNIDKVKKYILNTSYSNVSTIRQSVKIEDGCNNFCTYCIIPYVRGRVRSRNIFDIENEVKKLVKQNVKEIVLVGIEIASYGKDLDNSLSLIDVIEKVSKIEGVCRIRLGSIEPRWLTNDNVERLAKIDKLCNHFHISVQSLDNNVLKRMNRKYTREFVFDRVDYIRKKIKDIAFTCDIIVGFPYETEEEFKNTLEGVKYIKFSHIHVFKYSKRKGTKAYEMLGQVDGNIKAKRSNELIEIGNQLRNKYIESYLNKEAEILVEECKLGYIYGYTSNYIKVKVKGDEKLWGTLQKIELLKQDKDLVLGNLKTKK